MLTTNAGNTTRERLSLMRLFEELRALGYEGGYAAVRRCAQTWSREHASQTAAAFVRLSFAPGEAYQFGWRHEIVPLLETAPGLRPVSILTETAPPSMDRA
jgi:hypothetical protein